MAIPRIYCSLELGVDSTVTLERAASHHLSTVLRVSKGKTVCLFNGDGNDYHGKVQASGKSTSVTIETMEPNKRESALDTCLIQGISRGDRMDYAVQKSVEMGVNRIITFHAEHSGKRLTEERQQKKINHWQAIVKSAAEQSGRSHLPVLEFATNVQEAIALANRNHSETVEYSGTVQHSGTVEHSESVEQNETVAKWVLLPESENSLANLAKQQKALHQACLIVGPESGLSEAESLQAGEHGFLPVSIGPRILRTETAAVAGLGVLQTLLGDFA